VTGSVILQILRTVIEFPLVGMKKRENGLLAELSIQNMTQVTGLSNFDYHAELEKQDRRSEVLR
jgi:hypothetical protein